MTIISSKSILIALFVAGIFTSCGTKKEEVKEDTIVETTTNESQQSTTPEQDATSKAAANVTGELILEKTEFSTGEKIKLTFKVSQKLADRPWIGIIPSEIPHGDEAENDLHDIEYQYFADQESGVMEFTAPANAGKYDLRMHSTDNTGVEITSISFEVK